MKPGELAKRTLRALHCDRVAAKIFLKMQAAKRGFKLQWPDSQSPHAISVRKGDRVILTPERHYVYAWDMIQFFDYYFSAVVAATVNGLSVVDYSKPGLHRLSQSKTEFFFTSLPESDKSTEIYLEHAKLKEGDIVFDCGAYCGGSSYFFSRQIGPTGKVFSFEPDPHNFKALQTNIASHNLTSVTAINKGLWSSVTDLEFQAEGSLGSSLASVMDRKSAVCKVSCITLEEAARGNSVKKLDFIKLDIEGAELDVLKASREFLRSYKPKMMIEPHMVQGVFNMPAVISALKDIGFETKVVEQDTLSLPLVFAGFRA